MTPIKVETEAFTTTMPVPTTVYVKRRNDSMWELARSVLKFGAAETNDNGLDEDSSHLSSQSDKEHHYNMRGSRKNLKKKPNGASTKRSRENPGSQGSRSSKRRDDGRGRFGKRTGLDNYSSDDDSEGDVVVESVAKRHDFDDDLDDSDDEQLLEDERSSWGRMSVGRANSQRAGRVSNSPGGVTI